MAAISSQAVDLQPNGSKTIEHQLRPILTPELFLAVYHLKLPFAKGVHLSGAVVGAYHFAPSAEYLQAFFDLIFHRALEPLSKIALDTLLSINLTNFLPSPHAPDYPEQAFGLVTLLDQTRVVTSGYGQRYTRAFFDPVCEQLGRQLISLPDDLRPDGKQAWLSRGYSIDDWLIRTLWFWAPLVHSDTFMTKDRQTLKDWLHYMRREVEDHAGVSDPFAEKEAEDDLDIKLFSQMFTAGPPKSSHRDQGKEASVYDYAFWWIRILNAHFVITDTYGHYPYWVRTAGHEMSEKDKDFMEKTDGFRFEAADEPVLQQIREDYLKGVWRPLEPNPKYEQA